MRADTVPEAPGIVGPLKAGAAIAGTVVQFMPRTTTHVTDTLGMSVCHSTGQDSSKALLLRIRSPDPDSYLRKRRNGIAIFCSRRSVYFDEYVL